MNATTPSVEHARRVCEALVHGRLLRPEQSSVVQDYARRSGERAEEVVLELGFATEQDLLRALATHYRTRFVTTAKLAKAEIDRATLAILPRRFAEMAHVLPVSYDPQSFVLSFVTADPDDEDLLAKVKLASSARAVKPLVARPAAIRAAVAKAYGGDPSAFAFLDRQQNMQLHGAGAFERGTIDLAPAAAPEVDASMATTRVSATVGSLASTQVSPTVAPPVSPPAAPRDEPLRVTGDTITARRREAPPSSSSASSARAESSRPADTGSPPRVSSREDVRGRAGKASSVLPMPSVPAPAVGPRRAPPSSADSSGRSYSAEEVLELLRVFVSLSEAGRAELRGHSSFTARMARRLAERAGLEPRDVTNAVIAAYIHDLGKGGTMHLTALNVAQYEQHTQAAQKGLLMPGRLLDGVRLAKDAVDATKHMYERFDGKGLPDGHAGAHIPVAARILAVADTYADLTQNPRNPYRKKLTAEEACAVLAKYKGSVFDPEIVELLRTTVTGEDLKARLLTSRHTALLVDPDAEETTILELRMLEQGFHVRTARTAEQALGILAQKDTDLVVSELDVPGGDGIALLRKVRSLAAGGDVPWVFYTRRSAVAEAQNAFELGVLDFVPKAVQADVLVAKLKALLEQRSGKSAPRGVSGTLAEMGVADIIQVLGSGRKTGALRIRCGGEQGEIHVEEGAVVHARWQDLRGEDAFYAIVRLEGGDFHLDPTVRPTTRTIEASTEALLLEGMRRLDEE